MGGDGGRGGEGRGGGVSRRTRTARDPETLVIRDGTAAYTKIIRKPEPRSGMRKEYIVKSIDSTPDGQPHVIVSLMSAKDMRDEADRPQNPFDSPKVMGFSNMNDMMKDLNKMLSGMGGGSGTVSGITSIKLDMHEYKDMGLSVGDRVYVDLTKAESLGV